MAEQSFSSLQQQEEEKTVTSPGQKDTTKEWDRMDESHDSAEVVGEVFKVLQVKRWEAQDGPFRGFGSPPGRF
jgi:hypothetical protein